MVKKKTVKKNLKGKKEEKDNTFYWIIGTIIFLVLVFVATSSIIKSFNKFDYQGLEFTKEKFGELDVYHYYRYYTDSTGQLVQYNLYLRIDPRKNEIPVSGETFFPKDRAVLLSINATGLDKCELSSVAIGTLTSFLIDNGIRVNGASPDEEIADEAGIEYANCENKPRNAVILIQESNETKISQDGRLCNVISVSNCEIRDAIEKFEVSALLDARGRVSL